MSELETTTPPRGIDRALDLDCRPSLRKQILWFVWISVCLPCALGLLTAVFVIDQYDRISGGPHAAWVRRLIPWQVSRLAALLPLACALPLLLGFQLSPLWALAWLVIGLGACEVYSVCLHRE